MKRKTHLLGWLLLATTVGVQAQFTYTVTNQTVTITGYTGASLHLVIPSAINGLPVASIGRYAFDGSSIISVTVPDSVTTIGDDAFDYCPSLTSVTIPNSVTNIGDRAFWNCPSLTNLILGSGVTSIGVGAFGECTSLSSVTIPGSVTNIGYDAFFYCTNLTNLMVDPLNSAYSSVDGVLFNQAQTTLVAFPGGKLGGYTIPNSVTSIGDRAFSGCTSLTSLTLGSSITRIGALAFAECSSLTSVTIPNSVTNIGEGAFVYCTSLTSVTIPGSVTSIGEGAFVGCFSLTNIMVGPLNSAYSSVDGVLFNQSQTTLVTYPGGKVGGYTIPNSVTSIGAYAFQQCTGLSSVTIPNSVANIGDFAFQVCSSLTNLTLGSGVTSIGPHAFGSCTSLSSVTIPNSVTHIGGGAFSCCFTLTSVYFQGNAPSLPGPLVFVCLLGGPDPATIYYLPGTTGWNSTFAGRPTALWRLPFPLILTHSSPSFGVRTNQFGFSVSWATNRTVVVEAASDLANPLWSPVQTNTLTSGSFYFSDPLWTNYPTRFYRIQLQ